jgi:U3 small nucleolar RNA-associated protein 3
MPKKGTASDSEVDEVEDEDAGGWGTSKRDYYDADNIETEADALEEEAEAKRLQQKKLQKMSEADFGLDENEWLEVDNDDDEGNVITEVLKDVEITPDMSKAERLSLLQRRYPEFESLANEFLQLQPVLEELQVEASGVENSEIPKQRSMRLTIAKHRALAAYMGALTMYFAVITSTAKAGGASVAAIDPLELRDHSVMESLLHSRELWSKVKALTVPVDTQPEEDLESAEADIPHTNGVQLENPAQSYETKKSKKQRAREKVASEAAQSRMERIRAAEEGLQDLSSLIPKSKKPTRSTVSQPIPIQADSDSDFGEEEALSTRALAEKAAKKKSLRFYTSQITQKANRRAGAGRDAGGDADIPHREHLRDRQTRLNAEAEARGKKLDSYGRGGAGAGTTLGADNDSIAGSETELANAVRGDEDEYYDMAAQVSRKRKDEKLNVTQLLLRLKRRGNKSGL